MVEPVSFLSILAVGVFFDGLLYAGQDDAGAGHVFLAGIIWLGVAWVCSWVAGMLPPLGVQLMTIAAPGVGRFLVPKLIRADAIREGRRIAQEYE